MWICEEFEEQVRELDKIEPEQHHAALKRFKTASWVVYDTFNNGLTNAARKLRVMKLKKSELPLDEYRYGGWVEGDWDRVGRYLTVPMREIILDACDEHNISYDNIELNWNEEQGYQFDGLDGYSSSFIYERGKLKAYVVERGFGDATDILFKYDDVVLSHQRFPSEDTASSTLAAKELIEKSLVTLDDNTITIEFAEMNNVVSFEIEVACRIRGYNYLNTDTITINGSEADFDSLKNIIGNEMHSYLENSKPMTI